MSLFCYLFSSTRINSFIMHQYNICLTGRNPTKREGWSTLIIMSLATFIICFDATFMNVSIQNLIQELNTTLPFAQAMISIYSLTMTCLMLPGAKIQDIYG